MRKALVIGGAGYIGSHTVHELCNTGEYAVEVMDDLSTGRKDNVDTRAGFIEADMCDPAAVHAIMRLSRPDVVFCFAGLKAAGASMECPDDYSEVNIVGVLNVLNAMMRNIVKDFVFSSSAAVYGKPISLPIEETHPIGPENYYGYTKLAIEDQLKWFSRLRGINYASLRYFNAAGYLRNPSSHFTPHRETSPTNLLPVVMETACRDRTLVEVYGDDYDTPDGTGIRDYIHVEDLALAHIYAAEHIYKYDSNIICNLGTGNGYSVYDVISEAEKVTNKSIPYAVKGRREGDASEVIASYNVAKYKLGWEPRCSDLGTILESMWRIYNR